MWAFSVWTADQWVCITSALDPDVKVLEAGTGELTCVIDDLSLVAGRYSVRASFRDPQSELQLAHWE